MKLHSGRRQFLGMASIASLLGNLIPPRVLARGEGKNATTRKNDTSAEIYTRLGVRPVINAVGTVTVLGGVLMPPEVVAAMEEAAQYFISMPELLEKSGEHIAQLLGVEAAVVTTGAAGAITLATAACVTGTDSQKIRQLPDTRGMRNEVVMQKSHRCGYEAQMLLVGTKIIEIETRSEVESAISDRTAMLFFLNKAEPDGKIRRDEWIALGKKHQIPTFNDAAADLPPKAHLSDYCRMGFDLVAFSGGKGLLGPQCSGLLLGRRDLVDAARINASPFGGIGRGMKVGKEEIIGLIAALERYLKVDHEAEFRELDARVSDIAKALSGIRGVKAERFVPEIANHLPHLAVDWDSPVTLSSQEVVATLRNGEPRIEVSQRGPRGLTISVWMLRPGEHKIVAQRLGEVLGRLSKA
jgi:D-glucosaminate-6-phosphate ammonia-lyase